MTETDRVVLTAIADCVVDLTAREVIAIGDAVLKAMRDHTPNRVEVMRDLSRTTGCGLAEARRVVDSLTA